jgi:hypothetical protein
MVSGLYYLLNVAGDALGIFPQNNMVEINELLGIVGWTGSETINLPSWAYSPKPGYLLCMFFLQGMYALADVTGSCHPMEQRIVLGIT